MHRDLIELCRKGDSRSQYRLYKLYSKAMYNICIRMVPNKIDAEDVLQDAFVSAFRNLKSYRGDSSFGAWLKRIVINKCIDFLRQKRSFILDEFTDRVADIPETDEGIPDLDPEIVHHAIKELPEGARVVFNLFCMEGYRHKEIAETLGISESTSKSQYLRARTLLQEKLKSTLYETAY
jgi:RNA polymerase sigma-70 factor (ECF subfamily)